MNIIAIMGPHGVFYRDEPIKELEHALQRQGSRIVWPQNSIDLSRFTKHNSRVCGVIFDWDEYSLELCSDINQLSEYLPLYAFINTHSTMDVNTHNLHMVPWFFEYALGQSEDIATRICQYISECLDNITLPFAKALFTYAKEGRYIPCTPRHVAGTAYQRSPIGCLFHDSFGDSMLKANMPISITELGSLLNHTGPHLEAEECIAHTFGVKQSHVVVNGTSTSDKIVGMYIASAGSVLLVDRNCYRSLAYLLVISDMVPIWLKPTRNALGVLDGISHREFIHANIERRVEETTQAQWLIHAVITNSTYDGLLYSTSWIKQTLDTSPIRFDSAWVPYIRFYLIYQGKSGTSGGRIPGEVTFKTQSTRKVLVVLSQVSLIHIKDDYDEDAFSGAFMMHTFTSLSYPIMAPIETTATMLRSNSGKRLISRSMERALRFREGVQRLYEESNDWFFNIWQPEKVGEAECQPIAPGEDWHGFVDADTGHTFLDPARVTVLTPGMDEQGNISREGIPVALMTKFLGERSVVAKKAGPYNLLFLFSTGIDKTRAMRLLCGLMKFKRSYDLNLHMEDILPGLYAEDPDFYHNMRIQNLAQGIRELIRQHDLSELMLWAFDTLSEMKMTPHQTRQRRIEGEVETVAPDQPVGRVSTNMILPYPPGVPLLMPGEVVTAKSRTVLDSLLVPCPMRRRYPGLEADIHDIKLGEDDVYRVGILKMA